MAQTATPNIILIAARMADHLYQRPATRRELVGARVSCTTFHRAVAWLRTVAGAPLEFDQSKGRWYLRQGWRMSSDLMPAELIVEHLRIMLDTTDVIGAVTAYVLADLGAAAE